MKLGLKLSLRFLAFIICSPLEGFMCQRYGSRINVGFGVANAALGLTIYGIALPECSKECKDRPACAAFDYTRTIYMCKLYTQQEYINTQLVFMATVIHEYLEKDTFQKSTSILEKCQQTTTCVLTGCELPIVANGTIHGNLPWFGARIQLKCNYEFVATDGISAVCEENGSWSHKLHCDLPTTCNTPPIVQNADIENISATQKRYHCLTGFVTNGTGDMWTNCTETGWTPILARCLKVCDEPMGIPNATVSDGLNAEGSKRAYTCLDGYSSGSGNDVIEIICGTDGNWTDVSFKCSLSCGGLSLENGYFDEGLTVVGSERQLTCNDGFVLPDGKTEAMVTCSYNGIWEPDVTMCVARETLGEFCVDGTDCVEPNTTCFRHRCFCKPLYTYSVEDRSCLKICSQVLDTFTQITGTYIGWYWSDSVEINDADGSCKNLCVSNQTCLFYEHLHAEAQDCRIGTLSLQHFQEAYPTSISYYDTSQLYIRDCLPTGASDEL